MESIWITGKRFWKSISTFDSPSDYPQRIQSDDVQRNREAVPRKNEYYSRHNSNADICDKTVDYEFYKAGGISAELHGRTAKTANIGIAIRQVP